MLLLAFALFDQGSQLAQKCAACLCICVIECLYINLGIVPPTGAIQVRFGGSESTLPEFADTFEGHAQSILYYFPNRCPGLGGFFTSTRIQEIWF
jgi:hypothetical protein